MILKENGNLSNLGQALLILDNLTNNNLHVLYMAINLKFSNHKFNFLLFKILLVLFCIRQNYLLNTNENKNISNFEIILNRKYDKINQTLLHKSIERKNIQLTEYLAYDIKSDNLFKMYFLSNTNIINTEGINNLININIYETNKNSENVLHYSIKAKEKYFINYFIRLDSDKNILKNMKDNNEKTAQDYDTGKEYSLNFCHIWEAAKLNDLNLFEKILTNGHYSIDEKTPIFKNTPLHIAASNLSDKIVLFLIKNNCVVEIKNHKNLTPLDYAVYTSNKIFIKKFKGILNKEITEFFELENFGNSNKSSMGNMSFMTNNNSGFLNNTVNNLRIPNKIIKEIKNKIRKGLEIKNFNLKDIFMKVDENKNGKIFFFILIFLGKLEGYEIESIFTLLDIEGVSRDDVLLLMSYLDRNKNGLIEYEELVKILDD